MARILIAVRRVSHWDAILPVLPWLEDAGVELRALKWGFRSDWRSVEALARRLGFPPPRIRWQRRAGRAERGLLVGTSDDVELLLALADGRPFLAVPRLPLPVVLLSSPPAALQTAIQAAAERLGALVAADNPYAQPALSSRTGGLPFVATGLPELDRTPDAAQRSCLVVIHPGDLEVEHASGRQSDVDQLPHRELLEQVLLPLVATGQAVELRSAAYPGPQQNAGDLARLVEQIEARRTLAPRRIAVREGPGWNELSQAQAVLVFRSDDLWRGLAAGVQRIWYLAFAGSLRESSSAGERPVAGATLRDAASYRRFTAEKAWAQPSAEAAKLSEELHALSDGHASQRVAQIILAALHGMPDA